MISRCCWCKEPLVKVDEQWWCPTDACRLRQREHGQRDACLSDAARGLEAVADGHAAVHQHQLEMVGRHLGQHLQRLHPVVGLLHHGPGSFNRGPVAGDRQGVGDEEQRHRRA